MAKAIICDRCGNVDRNYNKRGRYTIFDKEKREDVTIAQMYGQSLGTMLDLCAKCTEELEAFLLSRPGYHAKNQDPIELPFEIFGNKSK